MVDGGQRLVLHGTALGPVLVVQRVALKVVEHLVEVVVALTQVGRHQAQVALSLR